MRVARGLAAVLVLATLAACTSSSPKAKTSPSPTPPASLPDLTAKQIMQTALDAARAHSSFRLVSTGSEQGSKITFVNDVADRRGKQAITSGAQHANIIVIDNVAYLRANLAALRGFFGVPSGLARRMADRWVSFTPADSPYETIAESVTLDSALSDVELTGTLGKTGEKTIDRERVVGVTGTALDRSKGTLYVSLGSHLPVREISGKGTQTTVFSRWGESVTVSAPPNATPYSDLGGASPSPTSGTLV